MTGADGALRYAPHAAAVSVGYVVFSYAAVPDVVVDRFGVGFAGVGLLMSAALASFTAVQAVGGRLVDERSSAPVLWWLLAAHGVLGLVLDAALTYRVPLALRALWGLAGGLVVTVGATHVARTFEGRRATFQQGVFGGMITVGGAMAFLLTPRIVALTGWPGTHAIGGLFAVPAIALLWPHRAAEVYGDAPSVTEGNGGDRARPLSNPLVLFAAGCYAATLGAYITLSTFVTAFFQEIGVVGPLNALALLLASGGRVAGGAAAVSEAASDERLVVAGTGIGAAGLAGLAVAIGPVVVVLPLVALVAVCVPFGAIFELAAGATARDASALAIVVAVGNLAALVLPAVTGWVRDATGGYDAAFLLLAGLNAAVAASGVLVARR